MRILLHDFTCPICKQNLENVMIFTSNDSVFADAQIWGEDAGPNFIYHHSSRIFFPRDYYHQIIHPLLQVKCTICDVKLSDTRKLNKHVLDSHNVRYCNLCLEHRNSFPSEFRLYNKESYDKHVRYGDEDGSEGHPKCEFCRERYYDKTALFLHLKKEHFTCHICDKDGKLYRYYNNYNSLVEHYNVEHFPCTQSECLERRFVVFSNEIDRRAHMRQYHPDIPVRYIKINISLAHTPSGICQSGSYGCLSLYAVMFC